MSAAFDRLEMATPEGVRFAFTLAGPFTRFLAFAIDAAAIAVLVGAIGAAFSVLGAISTDWVQAAVVLATFVVTTGYGVAFEWWGRGRTLGKRVLGLRVIDAEGLPLTFAQVLLRNLLRAIDALPVAYLVGGAAMFCTARAQRLGDLAAGTIVVRHTRPPGPDFDALGGGAENSLRAHPGVCARLRQGVGPGLASAAVEALLRRESLEPAARVELFAELARAFRAVTTIPPEATAGAPDEVFVRNVVEAIHQEHPGAFAATPARVRG